MELNQLDTDTLHHFLMEETKTFTAALRDGASPEKLYVIRSRVQELLRILNERKQAENTRTVSESKTFTQTRILNSDEKEMQE